MDNKSVYDICIYLSGEDAARIGLGMKMIFKRFMCQITNENDALDYLEIISLQVFLLARLYFINYKINENVYFNNRVSINDIDINVDLYISN